jgi:hypothetical protein
MRNLRTLINVNLPAAVAYGDLHTKTLWFWSIGRPELRVRMRLMLGVSAAHVSAGVIQCGSVLALACCTIPQRASSRRNISNGQSVTC